jgi:hypothetical protein
VFIVLYEPTEENVQISLKARIKEAVQRAGGTIVGEPANDTNFFVTGTPCSPLIHHTVYHSMTVVITDLGCYDDQCAFAAARYPDLHLVHWSYVDAAIEVGTLPDPLLPQHRLPTKRAAAAAYANAAAAVVSSTTPSTSSSSSLSPRK